MKTEKKSQDSKIAISSRETKKLLLKHGFSDQYDVSTFLLKVYNNVVSHGKHGRIPIPYGLLRDHGIFVPLHAEISPTGFLTAIKQ